jgi:hypothetical protein
MVCDVSAITTALGHQETELSEPTTAVGLCDRALSRMVNHCVRPIGFVAAWFMRLAGQLR